MPPFAIELALKYGKYLLLAIVIIAGYFSWKHHVESVQREKDRAEVAERDAKTARDSAELLVTEKSKVEKLNNEQKERLQNAITIYATRTSELNADVNNLVDRLRNNRAAAGCSQDAMPRAIHSDGAGKGSTAWTDREVEEYAKTSIQIENELEKPVNKLPMVK